MDKENRERLKRLAELRFQNLESALKKVVKAKQNYLEKLQKLDSSTYLPEIIQREAARLRDEYDAARLAAHEDVRGRLNDLQAGLEELHGKLDLSNPAWQSALQMIEMGGRDLDGDTVRQINESFAFDQPALRALQKIYRARGILYDGSLDRQVYEIPSTFAKLQELERDTFVRDGSMNTLAGEVAKVANLEGHKFEGTLDPNGLEEALNKGAGLPSAEARILSGLKAGGQK